MWLWKFLVGEGVENALGYGRGRQSKDSRGSRLGTRRMSAHPLEVQGSQGLLSGVHSSETGMSVAAAVNSATTLRVQQNENAKREQQ